MKLETRLALNALNRRFYAERAAAFSASRDHPWPGWTRLLSNEALSQPVREMTREAGRDFSVLDVGCGNGRFLAFLADAWREPFAYAGCDYAKELLAIASKQAPPHVAVHLLECDLCTDSALSEIPRRPADLIALFGVLHHIPGARARRELVEALCERAAPNGVLALTFWRFGERERFARRALAWDEYNASATAPIDEADLEAGDVLLPWGNEPGPPRYCHFADDREIEALLSAACAQGAFECIDRYCADGKSGDLNEYLVLRRSDAAIARSARP